MRNGDLNGGEAMSDFREQAKARRQSLGDALIPSLAKLPQLPHAACVSASRYAFVVDREWLEGNGFELIFHS